LFFPGLLRISAAKRRCLQVAMKTSEAPKQRSNVNSNDARASPPPHVQKKKKKKTKVDHISSLFLELTTTKT
jgi:hypothetical protein